MNLLRSLLTISFITFFSRLFGFIRDAIIARIFGIGITSDAFFVAFKIPNLLRRIFAEGAFSQVFLPILAEYKNKKRDKKTRIFISHVAGLLILGVVLVTIIGIIFAPWIIINTSPGFLKYPEKLMLTITLLRIMFPYIIFITITSMIGVILNTWNYFSIPAFVPTLLNISIICFSLVAVKLFHPPIIALAWSVIIGGILQLSYQLPYLKKINMLVLPRIQLDDTGVWRVLRQMLPAIIGVSINQISNIINTIFASFLTSGSLSWIYYADRLIELPSGVLGAGLGTVLTPSLSRSFTCGNKTEYSNLLDWSIRLCFITAVPCSVTIMILAHPLVVTLFQYGKFTALDVLMIEKSLKFYAFGLMGFILVKVLSSGFYSRQNIKIPLYTTVITFFTTQLMNLIFINKFKHAGLALSIGISACFNASILYWQLRKKRIFNPHPGWLNFFYQLLLAAITMATSLIGILTILPDLAIKNFFLRLIIMLTLIITGGCVYFSILWILGFRIKHFSNQVKK